MSIKMQRQREVIATGKSVEEAIANAKAQLGVTSEETGFEILDLPKRGFLGFGRAPAKVRVYIEMEEEPVVPPVHRKPERPAPKPAERPVPKADRPAAERPAPKPESVRKNVEKPERTAAKPSAPRPEHPKPEAVRKNAEKPETPAVKPDPKPPRRKPAEETALPYTDPASLSEKVRIAADYLTEILTAMGVENVRILAREDESRIELSLEGADLGVVIGRRGETLDALQYLTSLVANRVDGNYIRISIDSGDYRKKRAETLERLAYKLARNAVRTGRPTRLEPMNPYERRIIHAAVSHVEGATSASYGEEPNRRVVISPKNPRRREDAPAREGAPLREGRDGGRRGGRGSGRSGPGGRTGNRPHSAGQAAPAVPPVRVNDADIEIPADLAPREVPPPEPVQRSAPEVRTPTEEERSALPLYGKIDAEEDDE